MLEYPSTVIFHTYCNWIIWFYSNNIQLIRSRMLLWPIPLRTDVAHVRRDLIGYQVLDGIFVCGLVKICACVCSMVTRLPIISASLIPNKHLGDIQSTPSTSARHQTVIHILIILVSIVKTITLIKDHRRSF